jgi:para-aminobenzoate synthetase component I
MVSYPVQVNKFRYTDTIHTNHKILLQVSSEITGTLPDNWHENLGQIICSLLPAGSITGAPKKKTVEIIKEAEQYNRGYYTGIFGFYDGYCLDSAVIIRYIENINNQLFYKSGGGITIYSEIQSEYQELIDKVYIPVG